jgi:pimeloyl-ACP methyl ester carboxylesterase
MGGGAAINFALAHPSATRAIVAVDSTLSGFHWSKAFHDAQSVVYSNARTIGVDSARDAWLKLPIFRTAMANPRSAPRMKQMVGDYSGWHWLNPDPGVPVKPLAIDRLREIRARTLAMVGADDEPDFHAIADILASDVPGARKLELAGAGHMPPLERPDEFNAAVLEFLSR